MKGFIVALECSLKIEYTVFRYTILCGFKRASGIKNGAMTLPHTILVFSQWDERAINVFFRPGYGRPGATIRIGYNETFSRPHIDLMGSPCDIRLFWKKRYCGAMIRPPAVAWNYPLWRILRLSAGERGKCGGLSKSEVRAGLVCFLALKSSLLLWFWY